MNEECCIVVHLSLIFHDWTSHRNEKRPFREKITLLLDSHGFSDVLLLECCYHFLLAVVVSHLLCCRCCLFTFYFLLSHALVDLFCCHNRPLLWLQTHTGLCKSIFNFLCDEGSFFLEYFSYDYCS